MSILDQKSSQYRRRAFFLAGGIGFFVLIYIIHLFNLQVVNSIVYLEKAAQSSQRTSVIPALRGEIYDRNRDFPLVLNIDAFSVFINPAEVPNANFDQIVSEVAQILSADLEEIKKLLPENLRNVYRPIEIKSGVPFSSITVLAESLEKYPGVSWQEKPVRRYAETGSLSHILGYVGKINTEELQVLYNEGYSQDSILGKMGIEKEYDRILRGEPGLRFRTVDARGRVVEDLEREEKPTLGTNLVLTIDRNIQDLAEKSLGERTGSVVVLKPSTGEILALVSYPFFDPNVFLQDNASEAFDELRLDSRSPFLFRPIQSTYPPASTFKTFVAAAMLAENSFDPEQRVMCEGRYWAGDRYFSCHKQSGHGALNMDEAIAESCNVYFYTVGREYLGIEVINEYSRRFGFGQPTGIDLPGGGSIGLAPTPQWKERTFGSPWLGGDTINTSIGQGFLQVSPLQLANAFAMIVNEGVIYRPHLIKETTDPITGEVNQVEPEIYLDSEIEPEVFQRIQRGLRKVVVDGTANVVIITDAVEVAGKTGTAQTGGEEGQNHSWFASYGPYETDNPDEQVVVVTMVEASNEWEWWAPKAANTIMHGIFEEMSYEEVIEDLNPWYLYW